MKKEINVPDIPAYTPHMMEKIPIRQFSLAGKYLATFDSLCEAAKIVKVHVPELTYAIRGKRKSVGGYQWRRAE